MTGGPIGIHMPSVQSLYIEMYVNGLLLSSGTAFVARGPDGRQFLVTNRHNLAGRRSDTNALMSNTGAVPDEVWIMHNHDAGLGNWIVRKQPLYSADGKPLWLEHPVHGRAVDVVALPLTDLGGVQLYAYDTEALGADVSVGVTSEVHVIGFPFGLTSGGYIGVWTRGTIASEYGIDFQQLPCFLVDARTRSGQSGSPVIFFSRGGMVPMADGSIAAMGETQRLLGVYSGRINKESDLGIVWRADAMRDVVTSGIAPDGN